MHSILGSDYGTVENYPLSVHSSHTVYTRVNIVNFALKVINSVIKISNYGYCA